jgi:hypothetical protein
LHPLALNFTLGQVHDIGGVTRMTFLAAVFPVHVERVKIDVAITQIILNTGQPLEIESMKPIATIAFVLWVSAPVAGAEDRAFTITNASALAITAFVVTPNALDAAAVNMVPSGSIAPGAALDVTIPSANDACLFDLRIAFADGTETSRPEVDFCNTDGYIVE